MPDLKDRYSDPELNKANKDFEELVSTPDMEAVNDQGDSVIRDLDRAERQPSTRTKEPGIRESEESLNGYWAGRSSTVSINGAWSRFRKNRKAMIATGLVGGLVVSAIAGFFALLPLKFEMLIKTATDQAAQIPEHAIEHRLQYLTQYYIAQQILGQAYGQDIDVKQGSIMAATFSAWKAAKYEQKLGFTIESDRIRPGERAFNWRLRDLDGKPLRIDGKLINGTSTAGPDGIRQVVSEINGSSEMRDFLRVRTKEATKWHQYYKRYAMRKTLMRKFGVSRWAWIPEEKSDKLDSYAERKRAFVRDLRQRLYENTVGRVNGKTKQYFACLSSGSDECEKLKDDAQSNSDIKSQRDETRCGEGAPASCQADVDRNNSAMETSSQQIENNINDTSDVINEIDLDNGSPGEISKQISKQMLAKIAGGIGLVDTIMRMVNGVENGALNQVMYDRNATAYIGYSSEFLAINDQKNEGNDFDSAQLAAIEEVVGDFGSSPVWQELTGVVSSNQVAESRYERECSTDNAGEKTLLPKGDTLCADRKVIYEKNPFEGQSWWEGLANVADLYMKSIGQMVGWFFDAVGGIANILGFDDLMKALHIDDLVAKGMKVLLGMIYGAPITGQETGADAGDNIIGGLQSSYFALGQTGQDMGSKGDGGGLGIGGAATNSSLTAALKQQIAAEKATEAEQKPLLTRLFDTTSETSAVSQIALRVPSSWSDVAAFPKVFSSSLTQLFHLNASATEPSKNPFGFDFSYTLSDKELKADPNDYTEETCKALNDAREESYGKVDEYPIMVYTKTDPCALEKVVAASAQSNFIKGAPQYFDIASMGDNADANVSGGSQFRIATFNVLGASHTEEYKARMDQSIKVLTDNKTEIAGMQEFQSPQRNYFLEKVGTTYDIFPKINDNTGVNAIVWDKSRFTLVDGGMMPDLKYFGGSKLYAPWIKLQDIATQQQFFVLNTHDPAHPENADLRYLDAKVHLDYVQNLEKSTGLPVFMTGDFNSGYSLRDSGNITYQDKNENLTYCIFTTDGILRDAYDVANDRKVTCPNPGNDNSVDHIFLTSGPAVDKYFKINGGKQSNGSDVHDTHFADITIPSKSSIGAGGKFRISSYNIYYSSDNDHYDYSIRRWEERLGKTVKIIKDKTLEVVGLQEVRQNQWERIQKPDMLGNDYGIYPTSYQAGGYGSQNPIVWNKSKFELVNGKAIPGYQVGGVRDNEANIQVRLRIKETGQEFYVINHHEPVGNEQDGVNRILARYKSATERAAYVKNLQSQEKIPVFLTGDFNSGYFNRDEQKTYQDNRNNLAYCIFTTNSLLWDSYDAWKNKTGTCPTTDARGVDHIFMSTNVKATRYDYSTSPPENGSDVHNTLYADVVIPGSEETSSGGFSWPIKKEDFSSLTGCYPTQNGTSGGSGHAGIDIDVPNVGYHQPSTPVYAAASGIVTVVSDDIGEGISGVQIDVGGGNFTVYEHMTGYKKLIKVGQKITKGEQIGFASDVGASGAHHLHFGITTSKGAFGSRSNPTSGTKNPLDFLPKDRSLKNALGGTCTDSNGKTN